MQKSGSFSSSIRRVVLGMALLCSFVAAVGGLYFSFSTPTPVAATKSPQRIAEAHSVDDQYVGSQRCAECHQEIATRYQTHSMAHSFNSVEAAEPIEQLENAVVRPPGLRHYVVEKTPEGCWHHEIAADEDGQTIYSQRVPISFALGSGQRGRTYLLDRDGLLFQSPIGWYSQEQKWDLSPGYDPAKHQRFSRRIGNGCLFCHVGRVNETARGSDRYQKPPFLESSIGCERCHGPGQRHIQRHENGLVDARIEETIVNPAKLDPERREAVCNQCHLQGTRVVLRRDRSFWDFRPGQMVDDVWLVFLLKSRTDETGNAQAVSQVEQMYESKCYLESRQKLGCISCHDPHGLPPESRKDTYYRLRCFECHNDQSCSLPIEKQEAAPAAGSCIACHMPRLDTQDVPHTAQTDHRVLRSYSSVSKPTTADSDNSNTMKLFGNAELRVPKTEIDRGKGLLMAEFARARGDKKLAEAARKVLLPEAGEQLVPETLNGLGDDLDVLEALGGMYDVAGQPYSAVSCWEQVLRFEPEKESVLASLADLCLRHGNLEGAERYLVRLLKINPYLPEAHFRLADLLFYKGDIQEAIRLGERSLELDPNDVRLREWLAKVYLGARMPEKNRAQVDILNRIDKASANTKKK